MGKSVKPLNRKSPRSEQAQLLHLYGSLCWCPHCDHDLVSSQSFLENIPPLADLGIYYALCAHCHGFSVWDYATFLCPILLYPKKIALA